MKQLSGQEFVENQQALDENDSYKKMRSGYNSEQTLMLFKMN